jgi:hypothetical protein
MAYRCQYRRDVGVICTAWTTEDADYCSTHQEAMDKIDRLEQEIKDVIGKRKEGKK